MVKALLDHAANVNQLGKSSASALHVACRYGNQHMVKHLLDYAANVNQLCRNNCTPIDLACANDHCDIVGALVDHRANVNQLDHDNNTALHKACYTSNVRAAMMLVDFGADINIVNVCAISHCLLLCVLKRLTSKTLPRLCLCVHVLAIVNSCACQHQRRGQTATQACRFGLRGDEVARRCMSLVDQCATAPISLSLCICISGCVCLNMQANMQCK
jgi:hypothetical protein